jgi:hypothetical protein
MKAKSLTKTTLARTTLFLAVSLFLTLPFPAAAQAQAEAAPETEAASGDGDGFLYGRVVTRSGNTYTGLLRWGTQELFWDDLFNSTKQELPYDRYAPGDRRREAPRIGLLERIVRLIFDDDFETSRQFWVRFGDIDRIHVGGRRETEVVMKGGARFQVSGGGNDVGDEIRVRDAALGEVELEWDGIETIQFLPTPAGLELPGRRLYGRVETRAGTFQGFIQWDAEECISVDKLDGESVDGDLSIEMGNLRSIARNSRHSSRVVLADGRTLDLDGTNDVDSSIRGIYVEDPRYGRVEIPWDLFERLDFQPAPGSGSAYDSFQPGEPLAGTVTARGGERHQGRIVFDLDEAHGFEILQGELDGVELYVPFRRIASISPQGRRGSDVRLRNGEELYLEEVQDVSADNAGVLIFTREGAEPTYLAWDEVERIDFR